MSVNQWYIIFFLLKFKSQFKKKINLHKVREERGFEYQNLHHLFGEERFGVFFSLMCQLRKFDQRMPFHNKIKKKGIILPEKGEKAQIFFFNSSKNWTKKY